jgi:hypothetical protein
MPDPDKLLHTITEATMLTRATRRRRGRVIHINGGEVLAVGDLHGNIGNFQSLLRTADLTRNPQRHLIMQELIHGNFRYVDGSDKSHQAVDLWCALKCQFPDRVHLLPGNHELAQWTNRAIAKADNDLNASFRDGVRSAYGRRGDEIYAAYLELFAALPLVIRTPNRVILCHTLPSPASEFNPACLQRDAYVESDLAPRGPVYSLLWGRDCTATNAAAFLAKTDADLVITGHIPCEQGFAVPNDYQLILDCLGSPACYCLFPAETPLTHPELIDCVHQL